MLRVEEKEHDVFLKAAMFGERFYDGTDVSDSDAKLSDEKEEVSDVSQGKKAFTRQMALKKKKPMAAPPMLPHWWKCSKKRAWSSGR